MNKHIKVLFISFFAFTLLSLVACGNSQTDKKEESSAESKETTENIFS